ncbi:MAG: TetR/AcrR family transcriptional regulator [Flavobacteriales bacterium]|mgnify:CR=1 FL=1|jgi:AcrR family transcriptional regulator|nr:TetR/AcrR family transcriptional regulator [Flavobacteriales bacterium]MBK7286384.1 TetR/AcrR family transcriptional regulator [Flavobacteriales bacterium]MBK9061352.1 TetR/AcrR family transcriptional regulator [Flavobacteriales bacterium]QQS72699.1 MAG: TetR/AcrR family transcriptional regulator [Flavobacteriales bacterium]HQV38089.1 TetR/AcrR family transcriptional regulator [Flavobacteriales bacterium]
MRTDITPRQLEIIAAAGQLISEDGYAKLTTKRLAERMHFSEAALYRHFASKEDILVKMLELLTASVQERMEAVTAQEEKPDMRLRAMFDSHFTYFKAHPEYLMAIFATNFMEPSPVIDTAIKNLMEVMRHHLRAVVSAGQKAGTFTRVIPTDMLVQIVMGTFRLHMLQWRMTGKNTDVKKVGNKLINTVLTLIAAR